MHVSDIHWIVVEDGPKTYPHVMKLLDRSGIPYTYMAHSTIEGYPSKEGASSFSRGEKWSPSLERDGPFPKIKVSI